MTTSANSDAREPAGLGAPIAKLGPRRLSDVGVAGCKSAAAAAFRFVRPKSDSLLARTAFAGFA